MRVTTVAVLVALAGSAEAAPKRMPVVKSHFSRVMLKDRTALTTGHRAVVEAVPATAALAKRGGAAAVVAELPAGLKLMIGAGGMYVEAPS